MAKGSIEDDIAGLLNNIDSIIDKHSVALAGASKQDIKASVDMAKDQLKNSPHLDEALNMLKNKGINI